MKNGSCSGYKYYTQDVWKRVYYRDKHKFQERKIIFTIHISKYQEYRLIKAYCRLIYCLSVK